MKILMGDALQYDSPVHVGSHIMRIVCPGGTPSFMAWLHGPPHEYRPCFTKTSLTQELDRFLAGGGIKIRDNFWTYHPLTLMPYVDFTFMSSQFVQKHTLQFTLPPVRKILKRLSFERVELLWLSQSLHSLSLSRYARYEKLIYRMSDYYLQFKGIPSTLRKLKRRL